MGFVSDSKSIPKSISHSGGILNKSLGKTFEKSFTTWIDSIGGMLGSRSLTLRKYGKNTLKDNFTRF